MKKYLIAGLVVVTVLVIGIAGLKLMHRTDSTATTAPSTVGSYVALGDSIAAGVGLKTDSDSSACDRTDQAYPNKTAAVLHYKLTSIACSGASLPSGILGTQNVNQLMVSSQLDQLFALPKPNLISITIGANDAGWTTVFAKCYTGTCGTVEDTAGVKQRLAIVEGNLQKALTLIQQHYPTDTPKLIVTGYHQVFPTAPTANCTDLTGVDAGELAWGRLQQAAINNSIQAVVKNFSFAHYAPIDFSGHELCTADSWVQGLSDKDPYHPTDAGQSAFASQVETVAKDTK